MNPRSAHEPASRAGILSASFGAPEERSWRGLTGSGITQIACAGSGAFARISTSTILWRIELAVFAIAIVLLNLPLLTGQFDTRFIFLPEAVSAGEWWRVFTFPFVHVSLYHLLLDATAFFVLYSELREKPRLERFGFMLAAGVGSLLASLWAAPAIQTRGLCGLSGIAHGLALVSSLEMLTGATSRALRRVGAASLLILVGKSTIEAVTGQIVFASWHLGSLGFPIAVCHAGGVVGALLAWMSVRVFNRHFFGAEANLGDLRSRRHGVLL